MRVTTPLLVACLLLVCPVAAAADTEPTEKAAEAPPPAGAGVVVQLELGQEFLYERAPIEVKVSIINVGDRPADNPVETPLFSAFVVRTPDGTTLKPEGKPANPSPSRPKTLEPRAFYGGVLDLTSIYPQLSGTGTYRIHWAADGLISDQFQVSVIPRFNPQKNYAAIVETPHGPITIDLFTDKAPIAVKSMVDMARAGFYDDLLFHEVHRNNFVVAGDPGFAPTPRRAIQYPAESTGLPLVAGTVVMKPVGAAPPANGSEFMILLKPQPSWSGQVTVVGQVVGGLEIAETISRVPSSQQSRRPFYKPLTDVPIEKITIKERPPQAEERSGP